jgi:hypothetical protein
MVIDDDDEDDDDNAKVMRYGAEARGFAHRGLDLIGGSGFQETGWHRLYYLIYTIPHVEFFKEFRVGGNGGV